MTFGETLYLGAAVGGAAIFLASVMFVAWWSAPPRK